MFQEQFRKKFSLGLLMDTSPDAFTAFLDKYHEYIDNFYFSLPQGDHMHSRQRVAEQFHDPRFIDQFWLQLEAIRSHGIKLELLFNARACSPEDVRKGRAIMDSHGFQPDKIGIVDKVYDAVREAYPGCALVYSFNNCPSSAASYEAHGHRYSEYVIGRQHIRDRALMDHIHNSLHGRTILLVNNGCSHICGGCRTQEHCFSAHEKALRLHSAEYLYALQSIMPFELEEEYIGLRNIDLIKISSRNTDLAYLEACLCSYIYGSEKEWIRKSVRNYSLWAHLTWHMPYYQSFDPDRIIEIKNSIYQKGPVQQDNPDVTPVQVISDMTDRLLFSEPAEAAEMLEQNYVYMQDRCRRLGTHLAGYMIGVYQCRLLLGEIRMDTLDTVCHMLRAYGLKIWLMLPEGALAYADAATRPDWNVFDGIFVNDTECYEHLKNQIPLPVYAGRDIGGQIRLDQNDMRICSVNDQNRIDPCGAEQMVLQFPLVPFCRKICGDYLEEHCRGRCSALTCLKKHPVNAPCRFQKYHHVILRGNALWLNHEIDSRILSFISRKRPFWLYDAEADIGSEGNPSGRP